MYKSRVALWSLIFFVAMLISVVARNKREPVIFASDNQYFMKMAAGEKIAGYKFTSSQSGWDVYVSSEFPVDGYISEEYYSPIILMCNNTNSTNVAVNYVDGSSSYWYLSINFKKILSEFMEGKTYRDAGWENVNNADDEMVIYADVRYEKEIKQTILMALAGTSHLSEEDVKTYSAEAENIWAKMEKTDDMESLSNEEDMFFVITPEYMWRFFHNHYKIYIENAVKIKFYANTVEEMAGIIKQDDFMSACGLRRTSYKGAYHEKHFLNAGWTMDLEWYNPAYEWEIEKDIPEPGPMEGGGVADAAPPKVIEGNDMPSENTTKDTTEIVFDEENPSSQQMQSEWDINKKEDKEAVEDKDINPDLFSEKTVENEMEDFIKCLAGIALCFCVATMLYRVTFL